MKARIHRFFSHRLRVIALAILFTFLPVAGHIGPLSLGLRTALAAADERIDPWGFDVPDVIMLERFPSISGEDSDDPAARPIAFNPIFSNTTLTFSIPSTLEELGFLSGLATLYYTPFQEAGASGGGFMPMVVPPDEGGSGSGGTSWYAGPAAND